MDIGDDHARTEQIKSEMNFFSPHQSFGQSNSTELKAVFTHGLSKKFGDPVHEFEVASSL